MTRLLFEPKPWLDLLPPSSSGKSSHPHYRRVGNKDSTTTTRTTTATTTTSTPSSSVSFPPNGTQSKSTPGNDNNSADDDTDTDAIPETTLFSLPSEVIHYILSMLEAEQFSTLAQVSSDFLPYVYDPRHWRRLALRQWPDETRSQLESRLYEYKTWRKLCTHRPRLRTHGIYVVRHQFTKTSSRHATTEPEAPVFMVTYFRFLRFYTDGTVISLTSPDSPHLAYRRVRRTWWPGPNEKDKTKPSVGQYEFDEMNMQVNVSLPMDVARFPDMRQGTVYMHLTLMSTKQGACDRLVPTSHYCIMNDNGGDLVPYPVDAKPFRFISIWGFRNNVYREYPRDDDRDLAQWFEMKKAARSFQQQQRGQQQRGQQQRGQQQR